MRKIPTIFERDWDHDPGRVVDVPNAECAWVFAGEGVATVKLDGTCVLVRDGKRFKRREFRKEDAERGLPADFEVADHDALTEKTIGWLPVGDGPEDRWHREAIGGAADGTYELVGPKVQGNPEHWGSHELVRHGSINPVDDPPRTFDGLRAWFADKDMEGIVFHHSDGRMAKIKMRDFGLRRVAKTT